MKVVQFVNNMGRPTKLTPELIEKAKTYLSTCVDTIIETEKGGVSYTNVQLPCIEDFALYLDIHNDTVYDWRKGEGELNKEFSDIVNRVLQEQAKRLINKGLGGIYTPKIVGMILSKHGYAEKIEQDITTGGEKINMTPETLALTQDFEKKLKEQM